jgi:hypothetical protein
MKHPDQPSLVLDDVLALDDQRMRAMLTVDTATLEAVLSPDLSYTHSDGRTDTRDSYIEALNAGTLNYRRLERETVAATLHGEVALLQGHFRIHALDQGQEKAIRIHYLANWTSDAENGWRLLAWASTLIEKLHN